MKRFAFGLSLTLCFGVMSFAQDSAASGKSKTDTSTMLQGTAAITAQLENSLDVRKAKVGDEVILRNKKAIKKNGQTLIQKGATLVGRVIEVQDRTKGMAASKISILFDTLWQNGKSLPVMAMISSITRATGYANSNDEMSASTTASSSTRTEAHSSSVSSGGLIGGVVNTTTSAVSGIARTTGDVLGSTATTIGGTPGIVSTNIPGLQVSNSTDASVSGGSTLSMSGSNLKLEKGTTFNLHVQSSGSVSPSK